MKCPDCPHNWGAHSMPPETKARILAGLPVVPINTCPYCDCRNMCWPMVFRVSRELLHLAVERGAAQAALQFIEGTFAAQFPGMALDMSEAGLGVQLTKIDDLKLSIPGVEIVMMD